MTGLGPIRLTCEHRVDPLGIDAAPPRLSWVLDGDGRGQAQSAYRILVAGNEEDLAAEKNLLWDSGRVGSDRSVGIEYGGGDLGSGARRVWNVRVWDGRGEPSVPSEPAASEIERERAGSPEKAMV